MSAHVYRCYDVDGVLLYIGATTNVSRRMSQHRNNRKARASHALSVLMASHTVEAFPTLPAAREAEARAIRTEGPLLNIQDSGRPFWLADNDLARYLEGRGIPIEAVGMHLCLACGCLRGHHMTEDLCSDCRDAAAEGELDEWLESLFGQRAS